MSQGRNGGGDGARCGCDHGERAEDVVDWFGDDDAEFAVLANEAVVCFHVLVVGAAVVFPIEYSTVACSRLVRSSTPVSLIAAAQCEVALRRPRQSVDVVEALQGF